MIRNFARWAYALGLLVGFSFMLFACDAAPARNQAETVFNLAGQNPVMVDNISDFTKDADPGITKTINGEIVETIKYDRLEDTGDGVYLAHYPSLCRDGRGNPIVRTIKVRRVNQPDPEVIAAFTATTNDLAVSFSDNSEIRNCTSEVFYEWSFGDGATSKEKNPMHTYTSPGTYTVTERVICGTVTSTASQQVTVTDGDTGGGDNHAPILGTGSVSVRVGSSTTLNLLDILNAIDPDGDDIDVVSVEDPPVGSFSNLNSENGTVTYNAPSSPQSRFTVQVTATDGALEGVGNLIIEVEPNPPTCTITASDFNAGTIRGSSTTDVNVLATAVATNCSGALQLRDVRITPASLANTLQPITSQGPGWYRFDATSVAVEQTVTVSGIPHVGNVDGPRVTVTFTRG